MFEISFFVLFSGLTLLGILSRRWLKKHRPERFEAARKAAKKCNSL